MIKLERVRTTDAVYGGLRGRYLKDKERQLLTSVKDSAGNPEFKSHWRKAADQLKKETADKCGYCESPIERGDVDHFRPKARYWWLVYCYDNFIFSCPVCNQEYKSDNFPIRREKYKGPVVFSGLEPHELENLIGTFAPDPLDPDAVKSFHALCCDEDPLLLNPYVEDPEPLFKWVCDEILMEVEIQAADNLDELRRQRFEAVAKYYGLNREHLRKRRFDTFESWKYKQSYAISFQKMKGDAFAENRVRDLLHDVLPPSLFNDLPFNDIDRCIDTAIDYFKGRMEQMRAADQPYAAMVRSLAVD